LKLFNDKGIDSEEDQKEITLAAIDLLNGHLDSFEFDKQDMVEQFEYGNRSGIVFCVLND